MLTDKWQQTAEPPACVSVRGLVLAAIVCVSFAGRNVNAQTQQQYVYGSVPTTTTTSQVAAFAKNGSSGVLTGVAGSPLADAREGGALAIDGQGRFLFIANPTSNNISMFRIDQATGGLAEVPGSPFSMGPTENLSMAARMPVCLATEKSGNFLYVGYRFGNFTGQGAINQFLIDAVNAQLVPLAGQPTTDIRSSPIGMLSDAKGTHLYVGLGRNASTGLPDAGTEVYSIDPATGVLALAGSAGNAVTNGTSIAIDAKGRFFFDGWGSTQGAIDSALISPADGTATSGVSTVFLPANAIPAALLTESSGKFLYVAEGTSALAYSIDQTTGAITQVPANLAGLSFISGSAAADPLGPYLYALQSDGIHGFLIDSQTGALSEIPGSPFATGAASQGTVTISGAPVQALSGPVAAFFPAAEDFGSITVGQTSTTRVVTLTNTGDQGLGVNSLAVTGVNAGDFTATPTCSIPTVLAPNATCSISVSFAPTGAGLRQASVTASDNAPGSPQSIPLSGTGVGPQPAVTLAPGSLTFGTLEQGSTSAAQSVTVTNSGSAVLHISSVLLSGANPGDFSIVNTCTGAFLVGSGCTISVTFSPLGAGQRLASIVVTDDAPDSPQSVQLSGNGAAPPQTRPGVTLSASSVSFGTVTQGTTAVPQSITLTSSGTATLHITSVALGGSNVADLTLDNGCAAGAYASNATCIITAGFSPLALGTRVATITINDDAPGSPQVITVSATANPALTIAPAVAGGTSVAITAGQIANFNFVLTPGAGFSGTASFTCSSVPVATRCDAPTVQLTSGTVVAYTVSVSTTGSGLVFPQFESPHLNPRGWWPVVSLVMCAAFVLLIQSRSRQEPAFVQFAGASAVIFLVLVGGGCGGGSAVPSSAQSPPQVVTPKGTFTIMLTPAVTTSAGKQLPALPPIPLTLTVN